MDGGSDGEMDGEMDGDSDGEMDGDSDGDSDGGSDGGSDGDSDVSHTSAATVTFEIGSRARGPGGLNAPSRVPRRRRHHLRSGVELGVRTV